MLLADRVGEALEAEATLLQLPTGGGKTRIAVEVARRYRARGQRVWFVCHRREIMQQTSAAFAEAGVLHSAATYVSRRSGVQICSVNTLAKRIEQWPAPDLVIWDEAQHTPAPTWSGAKDRLRRARHLGLSATPARLDGRGLGSAFGRMVCGPDTRALIDAGHLSPFRLFGPTIPDLRGVGIRMGDYERGGAEREMTRPVVVGDVIDHYRRLAPGARAVAFCCSVAASAALAERLNEAGIPARHVDGRTPPAERDAAVAALRAGEIKVLSNVELFAEGFDAPAVEAVILLRPTKSLSLYRQMVGRALRTAPGKAVTTILDHAGLVHEHGLPDEPIEWSLDGYSLPAAGAGQGGGPRLRRCPECAALHAWAPECTECGYEYKPADRSVEEVYGELKAITSRPRKDKAARKIHVPRVIPPGCELQKSFALRVGYDAQLVKRLLDKGLPHVNRFPLIEKGLDFVEKVKRGQITAIKVAPHKHPSNAPIGTYEKRTDFARRVGKTKGGINKWVKLGLPRGPNGWIDVEKGLAWVERWRKAHEKPSKLVQPEKVAPLFLGEPLAAFQARTGVIAGKDALVRAGLPLHADGTVDAARADEWLKTARLSKRALFAGQEPIKTFLRRIGQWHAGNQKRRMLDAGLPLVNGMVPIDEALTWAKARGFIKDPELLRRLEEAEARDTLADLERKLDEAAPAERAA